MHACMRTPPQHAHTHTHARHANACTHARHGMRWSTSARATPPAARWPACCGQSRHHWAQSPSWLAKSWPGATCAAQGERAAAEVPAFGECTRVTAPHNAAESLPIPIQQWIEVSGHLQCTHFGKCAMNDLCEIWCRPREQQHAILGARDRPQYDATTQKFSSPHQPSTNPARRAGVTRGTHSQAAAPACAASTAAARAASCRACAGHTGTSQQQRQQQQEACRAAACLTWKGATQRLTRAPHAPAV
jgi:hypothetical protein